MNRTSLRFLAALGLCAATFMGTAGASDPPKASPSPWDKNAAVQRPQPGVVDHGRIYRRPVVHGTTPAARPGWDHGRKTGWGNCDVPPGQAKKAGCTPAVRHHDRRWVQRRDHRWQERRESERREAHRQAERHEVHRQAERRHERIEMARKGRHDRH